ncbi:hypothetical protein LEP1GSC081_1101 [Leptospira kirschneri str. H1]|uniref:Uncharacterized protein n=1 Tax=Leptospira kirschneri str. H1 TaxID=1049966 RepID=A0A0E2B1Z9_9LEPT|nr:hypothetical protein LEP1GSC081_1101 [Leptospira kirschneri str. H1]
MYSSLTFPHNKLRIVFNWSRAFVFKVFSGVKEDVNNVSST